MTKPLYISICSQKGGVGKSTFTCLLASQLAYNRAIRIVVLDCDSPQYSISKFRKREMEVFEKNQYLCQKALHEYIPNGIEIYQIIPCTSENALEEAKKAELYTPDIIFFDFPGTINSEGVANTLFKMDYLFIPLEADHIVLKSTLEFAIVFNVYYRQKGQKDKVWLFWNKVDNREVNTLYLDYEKVIASIHLPVMRYRFPQSTKFRKEMQPNSQFLFRSTMFPSSRQAVKGTAINMDTFTDEFLGIIQLPAE